MSEETTALARVEPQRTTDLTDMQLGGVLARSGYFSDAKGEAQAVVKVLLGRELGIPPVQSMLGINVIQGKPAIGAGLIATLVKRSGRYDYRVRRRDDTGCEIEFFEKGESIGVSSFTHEDAKRADLAGKDNWRKYPKSMYFARAMTDGARTYCPDVFGAPIYTPEELGAEVRINAAGEQEIVEAEVVEPARASVHPARQAPEARRAQVAQDAPEVHASADAQRLETEADFDDGETQAEQGLVKCHYCGAPLNRQTVDACAKRYIHAQCQGCFAEHKFDCQGEGCANKLTEDYVKHCRANHVPALCPDCAEKDDEPGAQG